MPKETGDKSVLDAEWIRSCYGFELCNVTMFYFGPGGGNYNIVHVLFLLAHPNVNLPSRTCHTKINSHFPSCCIQSFMSFIFKACWTDHLLSLYASTYMQNMFSKVFGAKRFINHGSSDRKGSDTSKTQPSNNQMRKKKVCFPLLEVWNADLTYFLLKADVKVFTER